MAFQPVVDVDQERVYAYEALARGPNGEPAGTVFSAVPLKDRYVFDHCCRSRAIELACRLDLPEQGVKLATNFMPGAIYVDGSSVPDTLRVAERFGFPQNLLVFEINEREEVRNPQHLQSIADDYRRNGFEFAIDDFGAGFANLNLLADLAASTIKLDMSLIRSLGQRPRARKIVCAILELCSTLNIRVIAEGVETVEEFHILRDCGVRFMQGYLLARPAFEALPAFTLPKRGTSVPVSAAAERLLRMQTRVQARNMVAV
ncbi:EAL domain-containing protein [Terriglobus sp.]|uniref:EAL domain-containing protein n=1 Tax=Terriglobus sp. TaxID=1889013 RepID=UPI003AFFA5DD